MSRDLHSNAIKYEHEFPLSPLLTTNYSKHSLSFLFFFFLQNHTLENVPWLVCKEIKYLFRCIWSPPMCQTIAPGMKNWVESYCFWTDVSWTYLTDTSVCTCWGTMWTTGPRYTQKQEHSGDTQTCLQFLTKRYNLTSLGAVGQIGECLISHNLINMIHDQFSFSFYSPYKR